jgi:hypothetical protein
MFDHGWFMCFVAHFPQCNKIPYNLTELIFSSCKFRRFHFQLFYP